MMYGLAASWPMADKPVFMLASTAEGCTTRAPAKPRTLIARTSAGV